MSKCAYCGKGYHPERSCMKKQTDMLNQLLEKYNISLTEGAKKKGSASNFEDKERVHALVARTVIYSTFIIYSGASRHMVSTRDSLSSLNDSNGTKKNLGDDSETESKGKGTIDIDYSSFNNVLNV